MSDGGPIAFLFDLDNTLLDNDRVKSDLQAAVERHVGPAHGRHFWKLYEDVREDFDYVDFPHTIQRFARDVPHHPGLPAMADELLSYPYGSAIYPGALDALRHATSLGTAAILSDGDPVYQPAKIARSGVLDVIHGPALVYAHKEDHLDEVMVRVPAEHYVLVDDKPRILTEVKGRLGERVTTVHVCQGKYAHSKEHERFADADHTIDRIAQFDELDLEP